MGTAEMILADGSRLVPVHFAHRPPGGLAHLVGRELGGAGDGTWALACAPNLGQVQSGGGRPFPYPRSNDVRGVSCPLCQNTDVYRAAALALRAALASRRAVV